MQRRVIRLVPVLCLVVAGCAAGAHDAAKHVATVPNTGGAVTQSTNANASAPVVRVAHLQQVEESLRPATFSGPVIVDDLVGYAVYNHPVIAAARAKARAQGARVPQVSSLDDPMLTTTTFLEQLQTAAGPQDFAMGLSQKFPWFGKRSLRGQVAYQQARAAFARLAAVELRIVEQVRLAYFEIYYLDRTIATNRSFEPRLREVIEVERTAFRNSVPGAGPDTVWQAEIELAKLQTTIVKLEQAAKRARTNLAQALFLPTEAVLNIDPSLERAALDFTSVQLVAMLDACQPELRARRREISRDRAAVALSSRDYYPDVTVGFNWYSIGSTGLSPVADGSDAYSVMAGVNVPINRRRLDAAQRQARQNVAHSTRQYEATWNEFRAQVETLFAEVTEHDRVLNILRGQVFKARQMLAFREEQYRVSSVGFQELIDDFDDVVQYEIELYRRQALREQAIARLERTIGCAIVSWPGTAEVVRTPPAADEF